MVTGRIPHISLSSNNFTMTNQTSQSRLSTLEIRVRTNLLQTWETHLIQTR